MKGELEKIAEITFTQFMNRHSWFADVGIELRNIQNELRGIEKRTKVMERSVGIAPQKARVPSSAGDSSVLTSRTEVQHISAEEIKQIRLKKKLSITQMAYLLNVSIRKYREWDLVITLLLRASKKRFLKFVIENIGNCTPYCSNSVLGHTPNQNNASESEYILRTMSEKSNIGTPFAKESKKQSSPEKCGIVARKSKGTSTLLQIVQYGRRRLLR